MLLSVSPCKLSNDPFLSKRSIKREGFFLAAATCFRGNLASDPAFHTSSKREIESQERVRKKTPFLLRVPSSPPPSSLSLRLARGDES